MKVKDLIRKLQKFNPDEKVIIRFAVSPEDEIGYTLETNSVDKYFEDCVIYANYKDKKEDCYFVGQVPLKEAYEEYGKYTELKAKIDDIQKEVLEDIAFENRLKQENIRPNLFNRGAFNRSHIIYKILKGV